MKTLAMFGYLRDGVGKSSTKALRNEGKVPCVLYGGNENLNFSMYSEDFKNLVYTPNTYKVQLDIDGKIYKSVLKDIQYHPVNDSILHADFLTISEDKEVEVRVPVQFVGNSVGVRAGGKLQVKSQKLRVKTIPSKLPDYVTINIDDLEIGKSIKVADLPAADYTILDSPNNPIVTIKTTRAAISAASEAATGKKK
ncbi:MAG: 50S ribosomal protein L25/general stress protein Ctc [Bacteroidia bacterium]|nr:50S ribosomal protein L25/general stress protein Ctc [Bacteroidia bacterium]MBP9688175.1 50S ribosomal protein L25/general stress protein Ctc [Bacteroidia bacterium]